MTLIRWKLPPATSRRMLFTFKTPLINFLKIIIILNLLRPLQPLPAPTLPLIVIPPQFLLWLCP